MEDFRTKIEALRRELTGSIVGLLADNGLDELQLSYENSDHIWVVWFDGNGDPYERVVRKVVRSDGGLIVVADYNKDNDG